MNFPLAEAIAKGIDLNWKKGFEHFWGKSYRLQIYLLVTSTTGFWTVMDCSVGVAVTFVLPAGAVSQVIITGCY